MYTVNKTYGFDYYRRCMGFDSYTKALNYLKWSYDKYYEEEKLINNNFLKHDKCYCDLKNEYARITWIDDNYMEFILFRVEENETEEEFEKYYNKIQEEQ